MANDRFEAVGLLIARDLVVLGTGLARCFPVLDDADFDVILALLEKIPSVALSEQRKAKRT